MIQDIDDRGPLPPPVLTLQPGVITASLLPTPAGAAQADARIVRRSAGVVPPILDSPFDLEGNAVVNRRRLLPLLPLRGLLSLSLLAVAGGSIYLMLLLTVWRVDPRTPQLRESFVDEYTAGAVLAGSAYLLAFVLQAVWSVAQSWNARRTTLLAPPPTTLLLHFVIGPPVMFAAFLFDGYVQGAVFVTGFLLTLLLWARSFSVMRVVGATVDADLPRLTPWGFVMSLHAVLWLLSLPSVFLAPEVFFWFTIGLLALQTLVFAAAAVAAWIATGELARAVRNRPQIRRAA